MSTESRAGAGQQSDRRARTTLNETSAESGKYVRSTAQFTLFAVMAISYLAMCLIGAVWAALNYPPALLVAGAARIFGGRQGGCRPADAVYMHAMAWPLWILRAAKRLDAVIDNME